MQKTGGQILVEALKAHGVDLAFCVPGESYLEVLDAMYDERDSIRLVVCRQEGGASYMAEAYGKLTQRPGICMVTRGPGATNASCGVHVAKQDSTPMILFVGDIDRGASDREAFQEVEMRDFFRPIAKWAAKIDSVERIPEYIARAFHVAMSGRAGPVVLALPEDMLRDSVEAPAIPVATNVQAHAGAADLKRMIEMLQAAERPVAIVGGGGWTAGAQKDIVGFLQRAGVATVAAWRSQHLVDNRLPIYIGEAAYVISPDLAKRLKEADVVLAIGPRLGEAETQGYTLIAAPRPLQRLIHIHPDVDELGRVYQADLQIASGIPQLGAALRELRAPDGARWSDWVRAGHEEWITYNTVRSYPEAPPDEVDIFAVIKHVDSVLPENAIVTTGAGNFSGWSQRFYRYKAFNSQLSAACGSMGHGIPAAVVAKLVHPDRAVVAFTGDGDFLMNGQELATAVQFGAAIVIVLNNNGMYGTIRTWQEMAHPGRVYGTDLTNPDFVRLAQAYGGYGELVERTEAFPAAFARALAAGKPALIELRLNPERITSRATISQLRAAAQAKKANGSR